VSLVRLVVACGSFERLQSVGRAAAVVSSRGTRRVPRRALQET
jgi:hypothetical protein